MQLEKMDAFFEARLDSYEEHMLKNIDCAEEFYAFTADQLPKTPNASVLDLGCGTGLELRWYYRKNPSAKITGIDLSRKMLDALQKQYGYQNPILLCGSYFDIPFGADMFEAAVSVESLHHFTLEEKIPLYAKLCRSLKTDGFFVLTDYFSLSDEEENMHRESLRSLKKAQGLSEYEIYHYDTPLTVEHEMQALLAAGFTKVDILKNWGATYTLKAVRSKGEECV